MYNFPQVHLSAGAWYFVDNVFLLLQRGRGGVLDLSEEKMMGTEGGSGSEHRSDVEVLTHPPDLLIKVLSLLLRRCTWRGRKYTLLYPSSHLLDDGT